MSSGFFRHFVSLCILGCRRLIQFLLLQFETSFKIISCEWDEFEIIVMWVGNMKRSNNNPTQLGLWVLFGHGTCWVENQFLSQVLMYYYFLCIEFILRNSWMLPVLDISFKNLKKKQWVGLFYFIKGRMCCNGTVLFFVSHGWTQCGGERPFTGKNERFAPSEYM